MSLSEGRCEELQGVALELDRAELVPAELVAALEVALDLESLCNRHVDDRPRERVEISGISAGHQFTLQLRRRRSRLAEAEKAGEIFEAARGKGVAAFGDAEGEFTVGPDERQRASEEDGEVGEDRLDRVHEERSVCVGHYGRGHSSVQDGCLKLANFKHSSWTCWVNVRNNKISQISQKVKENASRFQLQFG